jgi:SAM-dependent methyltransferase
MSQNFDFEVVDARDYDELRPGYAPEAVQWVVERGALGPRSLVVDVAAGTGQLSRLLVGFDLALVAVEPASNMRTVFIARLPSVHVVAGRVEALPFEDRSAAAVVVGNAFHHFDREAAFAELRRTLRPGGVLALFWAWPLEEEHRSMPGMEELYEVVERARTDSAITAAYRSWAEPPLVAPGFGPFERREFRLTHRLASARLADLYATSSDVASMPRTERDRLLDQIRTLARRLPETLRLPSRTVVDLTVRVDDD